MNKLRIFLSFIVISLGFMNASIVAITPVEEQIQTAGIFTTGLTAFAASCSALGNIFHYKSGAPEYNLNGASWLYGEFWFHRHANYPTRYHSEHHPRASAQQKNFSRAASLLLKTGSTLKRPCGLLWFLWLLSSCAHAGF